MIDENNKIWLLWGIFLAVLLLLPVLISFVINVLVPFKENRDLIKMEMNRTKGRKHRYWKRELKKLYISHIPIVRWFFRKKYW